MFFVNVKEWRSQMRWSLRVKTCSVDRKEMVKKLTNMDKLITFILI